METPPNVPVVETEAARRTRDGLLAIAGTVVGTADLTEALRVVCRELARLTGAETVGAHLLDREHNELRPVAGYHIPKEALGVLAGSPVSEQPFWPAVVRQGEVVWSADVSHDERFAFHLFRGVPHQSGIVIPLVVDGEVAGTFYLVWWKERRLVTPAEAAVLQTVGRQVGLFLRNVRLTDELRRTEARYRVLFERSFVGIFRTRGDGIVLECNDAFARILGYDSAAEMRGRSVVDHYANPADRDAVVARISAGEDVIDAELTGRRRDGSLVPVAMSARRVVDQDGPVHEGVLVDLTDRRRAEEAVTLRSVAQLANGAAHEINNPLAVVTGQLEMLRQSPLTDAKGLKRIESALAAARRITQIIARMARITRLERLETSPNLPPLLDLSRSGEPPADETSNRDDTSPT